MTENTMPERPALGPNEIARDLAEKFTKIMDVELIDGCEHMDGPVVCCECERVIIVNLFAPALNRMAQERDTAREEAKAAEKALAEARAEAKLKKEGE